MHGAIAGRGKGLAPQRVRGVNRALVLQLLRRFRQLSRADIARRTALSEGTVSRIIAELMQEHLVTEQGVENSTGGRPGTLLRLDSGHFCAVGAEIQNWETRVAVGTVEGRAIEVQTLRTPSAPPKALDQVANAFEIFARKYGPERIEGLGVAVRGIVNSDTGVIEVGSTPSWSGTRVKEHLQKRLNAPIYVENNIRVAALAEYDLGAPEAHSSHSLLFVKVDEGVGMGIVLDGRLHRGPHMAAGEFGQMVICDSPGDGRHDRPGCLESLASNTVICDRYAELLGTARKGGEETASRARQICYLAMQGDEPARQALVEACRYLGIGIANAVWGLDADMVVIDGIITEAWPLVSEAIRRQFPTERELSNFHHLVLRPCAFRGDGSLLGALVLPFAHVMTTGQRAAGVEAVS
ncbi:MAG: ROK family transcriptional regulator [Acidobacteria bacterium]|nr:MAG: ROK family transcriptional regulator [Acidobacteriota bacterium]